MIFLPPLTLNWVCAEVSLWRAYCREKPLEQEATAATSEAAIQAHPQPPAPLKAARRHWGHGHRLQTASSVRHASGWSEREVWVAKQSRCFEQTDLVFILFTVFRVKQTGCLTADSERSRWGSGAAGSLCPPLVPARSTPRCRTAVTAIPAGPPSQPDHRPCRTAVTAVQPSSLCLLISCFPKSG